MGRAARAIRLDQWKDIRTFTTIHFLYILRKGPAHIVQQPTMLPMLCNNPDYGNQTVHLDQVILIKHILCFCQTSCILFQVRSGIIYAHKQAEHISTYLSLPCVIRLYLWILRWQRGVDLRQAVGILLFVLYATLERSPSTIADLICLFQY